MDHVPAFDVEKLSPGVFFSLNYVKKQKMHLDNLLNEIKCDISGHDDFVALYVYRSGRSYTVCAQFCSVPKFPAKVAEKLQITSLTQKDLIELGHRQLYSINKKGWPTLAYAPSQYGIGYYFNPRKVKQHENLTVLNVFNPREHAANLDFDFSNAMFTFDDESILGETFYVADEWSKDVRVAINEEAELAFNAADESSETKNFRDYITNDMVLIKYAGYVRRGCVLSCSNNICEVLCVDYGVKLRCSNGQLRIAPSSIAHTRFLAIPCILNGVERSASRKVRKYVNELIHQLDRSSAEFVVLDKDERGLQKIDILFKDNISGEHVSAVKYLEKAELIKRTESTQVTYTYDFGELLSLVVNARPTKISPEKLESIQRPFVNPSEFLSSAFAKKLNISV